MPRSERRLSETNVYHVILRGNGSVRFFRMMKTANGL